MKKNGRMERVSKNRQWCLERSRTGGLKMYKPRHCKKEMKLVGRQGDLLIFNCRKCGIEKCRVDA